MLGRPREFSCWHPAGRVRDLGTRWEWWSNPLRLGLLSILVVFWPWNVAFGQDLAAVSHGLPDSPAMSELPDAPEPQNSGQASPSGPASNGAGQTLAPAGTAQISPGQTNPEEQPLPGTIRGVVQDRDGAVYQGVQISLTQHAAIQLPERNAISDVNGRFVFAAIPAGPFTLTVSSEGFATQQVQGILHAGEVYEAPPVVLPFANATTEIRVTASREEIAQEEMKQEEKQRVLGVVPNFYVVYAPNAPPLNSRQKFHLAWKSSIDPVSILAAAVTAGIQQEDNDFRGFGQGTEGYAKRFGANYADDVIGTFIGSAILPSLLKQDPRYFYKGTGTKKSRFFYALANSVICKGDNGRWQPNYSAILGGLAAGGISNLYYPAADRNGAGLTFQNLLIGTAGTAGGNLFQEFLVKRLTPKVPNYSAPKP